MPNLIPYRIFSGTSHPELAREICKQLHVGLGKITLSRFACGEIYINVEESVRGKEVFIVQTSTSNINEDYMELFLLCDVMKRAFATKVHVILPHFGYARQDKIHEARETISAKLMANLIVRSGADHVITLNLHSDQIMAFFDVPVDNLNSNRMLAAYIKKKNLKNAVVVSPDVGGAKNAKKFATALGFPLAILQKERPRHNMAEINNVIGDVSGKIPILFDDMIDTGGSVVSAKKALVKAGAKDEVYLVATHAIFSGHAPEKLREAKFKEVVVTNSTPITPHKNFPELKVLSIAPLIADVIKSVVKQKSVSELYF